MRVGQREGPHCCGVSGKAWELLPIMVLEVPSAPSCPRRLIVSLGKDVTGRLRLLGSRLPSLMVNILTNGYIPRLVPRNIGGL